MRRRGFSLVEMLMVVGIVAVLSALVFPAFVGAKVKAAETRTGGSLRQLWTATQIYMTDFDLDRPPFRLDPLDADSKIRSVMRTPGAPWRPGDVDSKARPECPYLGDVVYMRYVHPLWTDEGWYFWAQSRLPSLPASFKELRGLPFNLDLPNGGCGSYEARMVSRSLQIRLDGSMRSVSHLHAGQDYFMYGKLLLMAQNLVRKSTTSRAR